MKDFTEDETCKWFVLPALERAGWEDAQVWPQYPINDGRISATAKRHRRDFPLRADYGLEYRPGLPIGVVEAKRTRRNAGDGIEQAKRYARRLDVPFAYATNGKQIYEIDLDTGRIDQVLAFPSPDELWRRYCAAKRIESDLEKELALAPFNHLLRNWDNSPKRPRYYQRVAVNRAVRAIASGQKQILLTLATGTGKTFIAFLIVAKLWASGWKGGRKPRVLYLADRNLLVDQPKDEYFIPVFGDAVYKLGGGEAKHGRHIYFALYQSLDQPSGEADEQALFKAFREDYFDLVIVDECHRGSARESSQWRRVLEYFSKATQLGLTATPIRVEDADTYGYFGEPVYEYSLAQGIEDGYLAPYRVRKVRLNVDMTGWRPDPGQRDLNGREIPDQLYGPKEYERILAILERTGEAARYLTEHLHRTGRMGKTIVFCQNNDHAHRMRLALQRANTELGQRYQDYVCRITDADGPAGLELLHRFKRIDTDEPVIAVTSRMLSTGIDLPAVRNIVLFRRIGSMPEFKQIVGRGTRLCTEVGKLTFDIVDYVDATKLFNDPAFDGPPMRITRDETDESGHIVDTISEQADAEAVTGEVAEPVSDYQEQDEGGLPDDEQPQQDGDVVDDPDRVEEIRAGASRRFYVAGVEVFVWSDAHYVAEGDGRQLRLVEYRQFVRDRVLEMKLDPNDLRTQWSQAKSRQLLVQSLDERGVDVNELAERLGQPEADSIDLLLHVAWELPVVTREERTRRVQREHQAFFDEFASEAREILTLVLEKYAATGVNALTPEVLRVPPFAEKGTVHELAARFGGGPELRAALDSLGQRLFDTA